MPNNNNNNDVNIDIEKLRYDLMDFYGAGTPFMPAMIMEVINLENASDEEVLKEAIKQKVDLSKYVEQDKMKKR